MKKKLMLLPAAVFVCFIFLMVVLLIVTPKKDYSSSEKRYLADFPETNLSTVTDGSFEKGFEEYLADHFPFRNMWIGINAYCNYFMGNNGADGVYKCADGYLINEPITADNRVKTNVETLKKFSESTGVPMTFTLAPSTGYIMSDKLPTVHNEYIDDSVFDNVKAYLNDSEIGFVDLRESFRSTAAKGEQLYYRTDHHWTTRGAYTAYAELCKGLGIKPKSEAAYEKESFENFYGTTYSTSGFWFTPPDDIELWINKKNTEEKITLTLTEGDKQTDYHSMFFRSHLDEDDKYPVFVDGNHSVETIVNKNVKNGKVLVLKDSFCHSMAPFLSDSFNTVTLVDMRYYKNSVSDLVKNGGYDQILVVYGIDNFATDSDLVWLQ